MSSLFSASTSASAPTPIAAPTAPDTSLVLQAETFDLWGSRLIEASAGTGKTSTCAGIAGASTA